MTVLNKKFLTKILKSIKHILITGGISTCVMLLDFVNLLPIKFEDDTYTLIGAIVISKIVAFLYNTLREYADIHGIKIAKLTKKIKK